MRRTDREITDPGRILRILARCSVLHIAMAGDAPDGTPYLIPVSFGCEQRPEGLALYFHSAREGRKADLLRRNPHVCFAADRMPELRTGPSACSWSCGYESVAGTAAALLLDDDAERKAGLDCLMRHYGYTGAPEYQEKALAHTAVYRLSVESVTGKTNMQAED
jgi:nitroimidazol reductase NimA-like FMN-containing flavoprotein (pyridoxamine 5'-phosphate oxidase superfamily)